MSKVTITGPLFSPKAKTVSKVGTMKVEDGVADHTLNVLQQGFASTFRNPTGAYASRVVTDRTVQFAEVTDGGVIYGPWLEGVSTRNQTTRFRGYANFRKATQKVQRNVAAVARPLVDRYIVKKLD